MQNETTLRFDRTAAQDRHIRPLVAGKVELGQQLTEGKPRNFLTYIDAHRSILIMGAERNDGLLEIGIAYAGHGQQQVSGIKGGHIHSAKNIGVRSEEQTSELQSLMRISYAVFCLKKK